MRARGYTRYSTDKQTDSSLEYQAEKIREYCKINGIILDKIYEERAKTGTNTDRGEFQKLLIAARRKEFDAVVIYDITRASRDVADWFAFRKEMDRLGIKVISATQQLGDITNPANFYAELFTAGSGQHFVLEIRQKSMDSVARKAKQGQFLGGYAPLGYDIKDGSYIINSTEAEYVKLIFRMYAAGASYGEIISQLNGARGKRGRPLGKNSLYSILNNERYIGIYSWNKRKMKYFRRWAGGTPNPNAIRIENAIPPIIDIKTWDEVQKRMRDNERKAANKAKREYLLSGMIECAACGATYVGHTSTNRNGHENRYYCCGNKYRTKTCQTKNINADELETFVVQQVKAYILDMDFAETSKKYADEINASRDNGQKERAELAEIEHKINNGVKAILSGVDVPELKDELERLRARKLELQDLICAASTDHIFTAAEIEYELRHAVEMFDPDNMRQSIKLFVQKIYANADGSCCVHIGVHTIGCGRRI